MDLDNKKLSLYKYHLKKTYTNMKSRCYNQNNISYKNYGGRGITICDEWLNSFDVFYEWAINNGYQRDLTIDRIDNDGNYEPSNCRWVTKAFNCGHTRRCKIENYSPGMEIRKEEKPKPKKREDLIALRQSIGQTQEEFGELMGVTGNNQGQIENGLRKPSATYIINLMKRFNLKPRQIEKMFF